MSAALLSSCPGCGTKAQPPALKLPAEPVVLNYRYHNPTDSASCPRAPIDLAECARCGLIYNASFQPALVPYDQNYENTQSHSPFFAAHILSIISILREHYKLSSSSRILEIGCGKGDFLKTIQKIIGCGGVGYDTTYEGSDATLDGSLQFHKKYYDLEASEGPFDLIICRHVLEHVPEIGGFIRLLEQASAKYGGVPVVVETPSFEWIVQHEAFWDVFYEHCNYYTEFGLQSLFERNKMEINFHRLSFQNQYQLLGGSSSKGGVRPDAASKLFQPLLADLAVSFHRKLDALAGKIDPLSKGKAWGIWGAGAKGVTLATRLPDPPAFLIDSNVKKQGCYVPGTPIPIVSPLDARVADASFILVANSAYRSEIDSLLEKRALSIQLVELE
jgi:SAM-dependent methyltransferase